MEFKTGQIISSYQLLSVCGSGAYGTVFYAKNIITDQKIALKVLTLSGLLVERELRGLMNYRNCRHPNLLQIHHIDKFNGVLYYTMDAADNIGSETEYVPDTLANRLAAKKSLQASEVTRMACDLLDGLDYLHKHDLIHRDIKPDNILWVDGRATLADVGLTAQRAQASLVGTPEFMPEELLSGKRLASHEDDLYALGKVLYCALTGCTPAEFPHYPKSLTISDASPLIQAYSAACQSPTHIKSSQEMKAILSERLTAPPRQKKKIGLPFKFTLAGLFAAILVIFCYVCLRVNRKHDSISFQTIAQTLPDAEPTSSQDIVNQQSSNITDGNDNLVSDLRLIYLRRNNDDLQVALQAAKAAVSQLDNEVNAKTVELNNRKMTKKAHLVTRALINEAKNGCLKNDPLCCLLQAEEQIQHFLSLHCDTEISQEAIIHFISLLDKRDNILAQLTPAMPSIRATSSNL